MSKETYVRVPQKDCVVHLSLGEYDTYIKRDVNIYPKSYVPVPQKIYVYTERDLCWGLGDMYVKKSRIYIPKETCA